MQVGATFVVKEQMNKGAKGLLSQGPEDRDLEGGEEYVPCKPHTHPSVFLHSYPHLHLVSLPFWAIVLFF